MSNAETSAVVFNFKLEGTLKKAFESESELVREFDLVNEEWCVAYLKDPWYNEVDTQKRLSKVSLSGPLLHYYYDEGTYYFSGYTIYSAGQIAASLPANEGLYLIENDELSEKEIKLIDNSFTNANPEQFSQFSLDSSDLNILKERLNSDYIINNWHPDIIIDIHEWLPDVLNIEQVCSHY